MYCKACLKFYKRERHFHELFQSFKNDYFCPQCKKLIKIHYELLVLPLDLAKRLFVVSLFEELPETDLSYFSLIYSRFARILIKKKLALVLLADSFSLEEIASYNLISELFQTNIILLVFRLKTFY